MGIIDDDAAWEKYLRKELKESKIRHWIQLGVIIIIAISIIIGFIFE